MVGCEPFVFEINSSIRNVDKRFETSFDTHILLVKIFLRTKTFEQVKQHVLNIIKSAYKNCLDIYQ